MTHESLCLWLSFHVSFATFRNWEKSVRIEVSKEGVRFTSEGEAANGNVLLRPTEGAGLGSTSTKKDDDAQDEGEGEEEEQNSEKADVKKETIDVDMDEEKDEEDFKADEDGEDEQEPQGEEEEEESAGKKRKKKLNGKPAPKKKKAKTSKGKKGDDDDDSAGGVKIEMNQHVSLTFSLKYLANFSKSSSLSSKVRLMMSNEVPLLVSYDFGQGYIRYYLAPKIGDD